MKIPYFDKIIIKIKSIKITKSQWQTFKLMLIISFLLAIVGRYARMILITAPLMEEYVLRLGFYAPESLLEEIKIAIFVLATVKVIVIDTIINLFLLYSCPYFLRMFAKPLATSLFLKLYKFIKGDYR